MSELLAELGARDDEPPADGRNETLAVGELVDKAAEGGFAFLVGILTLIAIPFVGVSTPFGLAIALIGLQMLLGMRKPWLPKFLRRRQLSLSMLDKVATMLAKRTRWLVKITKRRWEPLVSPRLAGFTIIFLALGLALPIPIPGSNFVFLIPLFTCAVGVLEHDGKWIAASLAMLVVDIVLVIVFGATVVMAIQRLWHWLT